MKKVLIVNILLLSVLAGCQILKKTNRTPQSAGFRGYCSDCLLKGLDKGIDQLRKTMQQANPQLVKDAVVKTPVPLRSAVIMNKKGKPVCRVDLLKHPELMPSFAKPRPSQIVHQARKTQRGLASVAKKDDLPPCPDKYFSQIRKIAKNNVVVNGDKSHIRKVTWPVAIAICGLGISGYAGVNALTEKDVISEDSYGTISDTVGVGVLVTEGQNIYYKRKIKKLKKLIPEDLKTPDDKQKRIMQRIGKATKSKIASAARVVGTFCYTMAEVTHLVYDIATIFYE